MPSPYGFELVVFDMAGTTVADGDAVHTCLQEALLHQANLAITREEANAVMGIAKPIAIASILADRLPSRKADPELVDRIFRDFEDRMTQFYQSNPAVREMAGASQLFRQLRSAGMKVALDTGFSRRIADIIVDRLGWNRDGLFDVLVTSDEVPSGRPAPDMIFHAMKQFGLTDPARVVKVGDTPSDLQEGFNAGCGLVVGVTQGSHTAEELAQFPHTHLIANISEFPNVLADNSRT